MAVRDHVSDALKVRIRSLLAQFGVEIGAYKGSFSGHRADLLRRVNTVWDVGAHVGQYATQLLDHGYGGAIVSIEPSTASFRQLLLRANRLTQWHAVNAAVSDSSGDRVLNISENGQSSSLLPMDPRLTNASPQSRYVGQEHVSATTLDRLEADLKPVAPYYLKLDLQGGEMPALRGASSVLESTVACEIELSLSELYAGAAPWQDVIAVLETHGLALCDIERVFFDPASRDLLQVNGLFRRSAAV